MAIDAIFSGLSSPLLKRLLNFLHGRTEPFDVALWHKWETGWFVRTVDGPLAVGSVWRRYRAGKWEYQERDETEEEWLSRQV